MTKLHLVWALLALCHVASSSHAHYNCTKPRPNRSYLHHLIERVDVLVTATVTNILYLGDTLEIDHVTIHIRRVFKGGEYVADKTNVNVAGIMQSEPCPHRLLTSDTKVFALSATGDQLQLEAPLVQLNLVVLDALHSLSQGRAHKKRRKAKAVRCESSLCPFGAKCVYSTGQCECKKKCRASGRPVCGSDGVSYASACHLAARACLLATAGAKQGGLETIDKLRIAARGDCKKPNPCDDLRCAPGEECVVSKEFAVLTAKCVCPQNCPNYGDSLESSEVCSSHGVDYPSLCHLRNHACESKNNITLKFHGRCDPCQGHKCAHGLSCHVGVDRKPECRCNEQCPLELQPVCATDGNTYTNECVMKTTACKEERDIDVWKNGKCEDLRSPCAKMECADWANCRILNDTLAACECLTKCALIMKPVCGTDGETYDSECELKRRTCMQKVAVRVKHAGTCGVGVCSTFKSCKPPQVCVVVEGKPRCACPQCGDQLMEVCASDGRTYANECKMRRAACLSGRELFVKYNSICDGCEKTKCEFYSNCVAGGAGRPECKCPDDCPTSADVARLEGIEKSEVCGTDGVTYSSECHLRRSSCQQKKFIVVAFDGKCDACLHVECRYGEECRAGVCVCSYNCPPDPPQSARMCGENGVMYPSECHLQMAACQRGSPIAEMPLSHCHSAVATFGGQRPSAPTSVCQLCGHGAVCRTLGDCWCPPCDRTKPYPVCGSDGVVYANQCELNTESCRDQRDIHAQPLLVDCRDGNDTCQCNRIGSYGHTCDEVGQCRCRPGVGGAKCDHCLPGFWGIHLIARGAMSCRPCGCSAFGAARSDCEQSTGKCECSHGVLGDKCSICPQGTIMTPNGCVRSSEFKMPRDCAGLKCHHGSKCVPTPGGLPDCVCPNSCSLPHLGIAGNMSVCGTDGNTYDSSCQLREFACKHQIDLVAVSLGICEDDTFDVLERAEREKLEAAGEKKLGSTCAANDDCAHLNAICLTRPGRRSKCECDEGYRSDKGVCVSTKILEGELNLRVDETQCLFYLPRGATTKSNFSARFALDELKETAILRVDGVGDDVITVDVTSRRTLIVKFGSINVESRSLAHPARDHKFKISWKGDEVSVQVDEETKRREIGDWKSTAVQKVFIGNDGNCDKAFVGNLVQLKIDGVDVKKTDVRAKKNVPLFLRAVDLRRSASLKFVNFTADVRKQFRIDVRLKTNATNGLVWFFSGAPPPSGSVADYAALVIVDSRPMFTFDLGSGAVNLRGPPLSAADWTKISVERKQRNATISVDGRIADNQISPAANSYFDAQEPTLFVGHVPAASIMPTKVRLYNKPLVASLQYLAVNEFPIDFHKPSSRHGDVRLADDVECDACDVGTCVEKWRSPRVCRAENTLNRAVHVNDDTHLAYLNRGFYAVAQSNSSEFSLEIRTVNEYGLVWFEGSWEEKEDGDFLALFLHDGALHLAANLGNDGQLKAITTNRTVSDDQWHQIRVKRRERRIEVSLEGKRVITVVTSPGSTFLDTNGLVFIGGRDGKEHRQLRRLGLERKFVGCVRNVELNARRVNLFVDGVTDNVPEQCIH